MYINVKQITIIHSLIFKLKKIYLQEVVKFKKLKNTTFQKI